MIPRYFFHKSEYSIFSFLPNGTRIQDDYICLYWIEHLTKTSGSENHIDLLRVCIVHLTAKSFYVVGFDHNFSQKCIENIDFYKFSLERRKTEDTLKNELLECYILILWIIEYKAYSISIHCH